MSVYDVIYAIGTLSFVKKLFKSFQDDYFILMYHRVVEDNDTSFDYPNKGIVVTVSQFKEHIRFLSENYNIVSINDFLSPTMSSKPKIVITFDDGYKDNLTIALPVLREYNVPATIYVTTSFIDGPSTLWWYNLWELCQNNEALNILKVQSTTYDLSEPKRKLKTYRELCSIFRTLDYTEQKTLLEELYGSNTPPQYDLFMNWDDLILLKDEPLITIGSHAVHHVPLSILSEERLQEEILYSKQILEEKLLMTIDHFAAPFGRYNDVKNREFEMIKEYGYKTNMTTECFEFDENYMFKLPRQAIYKRHNVNALAMKLYGVNNFIKRQI